MSKQTIGIGSVANDGTGDPLRTGFSKVNANFSELYDWPGHVAGRWYIPSNLPGMNTGGSIAANSIRLLAGFVRERITIDTLGLRVTTGAVGNVQLAIYAADPSTNMPTGSALVSTASMATNSGGSLTSAASVQIGPGTYWFASNFDNSSCSAASPTTTGTEFSGMLGSTTFSAILASGTLCGYSIAQTFGTWPSLTSASFTELTGAATIPIVGYHVASIP